MKSRYGYHFSYFFFFTLFWLALLKKKKNECSIFLTLLDLYYTFKPFPVIAHGNSQPFSTLNCPDCHSLCRWCHYNSDTHPFLWHCLVWRHSPIIICAGSQSFALATRSTRGNHSRHLMGALSKLGEYLCIMSDAFGPIKRQESGWWERQWQEWIKSLIPSLTWVRRELQSQYVCLCLLLNSISCVATYSRHNIYRRSIVQIRGLPPSSLWVNRVKTKKAHLSSASSSVFYRNIPSVVSEVRLAQLNTISGML